LYLLKVILQINENINELVCVSKKNSVANALDVLEYYEDLTKVISILYSILL